MDILTETKEEFQALRNNTLVAMQLLYRVFSEKLWTEVAGSWGEYVESELGISQGFASKLLSVNNYYLIESQVPLESLVNIDYECLYLATKTEGTPEEKVQKAKTLTRRELKEERNETEPHEHEAVSICKTCGIRL